MEERSLRGCLYHESQVRGYIDLFLAEAEQEGREHYTEEQLIVTLIDMFTGGSGTMSELISYGITHLCLHSME